MTPKEERALRREIESHHDEIEDELAQLKERHDAVEAKIAPLYAEQLAVEAEMDALKETLHGKRLELAVQLKAREEQKTVAEAK